MSKANRVTKTDAEIIIAMTHHGMNTGEVARVLCYDPTTIRYHVKKIRRVTGLDPKNFYDLGELLTIARAILDNDELS